MQIHAFMSIVSSSNIWILDVDLTINTQNIWTFSWRRGVVLTALGVSTKLLYIKPN